MVMIEGQTNLMNIGTIPCQLVWDGVVRAVTKLVAVPCIGSFLALEFQPDNITIYRVIDVGMSCTPVGPANYDACEVLPNFVNYVQVTVEFESDFNSDPDAIYQRAYPDGPETSGLSPRVKSAMRELFDAMREEFRS
jgi:hypothetical protein